MGYVIVAILVVLIVAAAIGFFVNGAARRGNGSETADPSAIATPDRESPLGSTPEHAEPDGARTQPTRDDRPDVAPPVVGGEGEGRRSA